MRRLGCSAVGCARRGVSVMGNTARGGTGALAIAALLVVVVLPAWARNGLYVEHYPFGRKHPERHFINGIVKAICTPYHTTESRVTSKFLRRDQAIRL